jgi:hypothetical protein
MLKIVVFLAVLAVASCHMSLTQPSKDDGTRTGPTFSGGGNLKSCATAGSVSATPGQWAVGDSVTFQPKIVAAHAGGWCACFFGTDTTKLIYNWTVSDTLAPNTDLSAQTYKIATNDLDASGGGYVTCDFFTPNNGGGPADYIACVDYATDAGSSDASILAPAFAVVAGVMALF